MVLNANRDTMEHERIFVDSSGVEWEVYDESRWTVTWALDWEYPPQPGSPGLLFNSTAGRFRLHPCPENWNSLSDAELEALLARATRLI